MFTATRATELAQWLTKRPICGVGARKVITGANWARKIDEKSGIIFFGEYWTREGERAANGGHIDLWNGKRLRGWWSYFRAQWNWNLPGESDLRDSKRI